MLLFRAILLSILFAGAVAAQEREPIPLTALVAQTGAQAATGARLADTYGFAVEQLNAAGGVAMGRRVFDFSLNLRDTASTPEGARAAVSAAIGEGARYFLLDASPLLAAAAAAPAHARGRVAISPGFPPLDSGGEPPAGVYVGVPPAARLLQPAQLAARMAARWGGPPRLHILYRDDPANAAAAEAAAALARPLTDIASVAMTRLAFGADIAGGLAAAPPADVLLIAGPPNWVRAAYERGRATRMTAAARCRGLSAEALGGPGRFCAADWRHDLAFQGQVYGGAADFAARYEARFGRPARPLDAAAAAAVALYAHAFSDAESFDAREIRTALENINLMTVYGEVRFGPDGANRAADGVLLQVVDGEFASVTPEQWAAARPVFREPDAPR